VRPATAPQKLAQPWAASAQPVVLLAAPRVLVPSAVTAAPQAGPFPAWPQARPVAWRPAVRLSAAASWVPPASGNMVPLGPTPSLSLVPPAPVKDTRQESDLLDEIKPGKNMCDELTNNVRLVSLGCYCGPKLSFQQIGRGAETLPFDWIRTRLEGVLHFLRSGFAGFYDFDTREPVPGAAGMVMYRGYLHSFWHDDPQEPAMRERYNRRIHRLQTINAEQQPVLFVRSIGSTDELPHALELLSELVHRFGRQARLLLIVDFQSNPHGPIVVQGQPSLLIYYFNRDFHDTRGLGPYNDPVRCGLDWAVGRDVGAAVYPSLEAAAAMAQPMDFGYNGLGGLRAFEEAPGSRLRVQMLAASGGGGLAARAASIDAAAPAG